MRSAGLKYATDGNVAWNEIWATFCDLAMAGGPPHKGTLLEARPRPTSIDAPERYDEVVEEICRGVTMVTDLDVPIPDSGLDPRDCSQRRDGRLAAARDRDGERRRAAEGEPRSAGRPALRLEKEIKNVVTVIAKTCHYWMGHVAARSSARSAPVRGWPRWTDRCWNRIVRTSRPDVPATLPSAVADAIGASTGLRRSSTLRRVARRRVPRRAGRRVDDAALVAGNVLTRREGTTPFVPINATIDPRGSRVVTAGGWAIIRSAAPMKRALCILVAVAALTTGATGQVRPESGAEQAQARRRSTPTASAATTPGEGRRRWHWTRSRSMRCTRTPTSGKRPFASCAAG